MKLLILLSVLSLFLLACNTPIGDVANTLVAEPNGTPSEGEPIMAAWEVRTDLEERQKDANAARWRAHDGTKYRYYGTVTSVTPREEPSLREIERGGCFLGASTQGGACQSEWLTEVTVRASQESLSCLFKGDAPAGVVEMDIGTSAAFEGEFNLAWTEYANNFRLYDCRVIASPFEPTPTPAPTPPPTPTPLPFSEFEMKVDALTSNQDFRTMLVDDVWAVLFQDAAFREAAGARAGASVVILHIPDKDVAFNALLRLYETNPDEVSLVVTCWESGGRVSVLQGFDENENLTEELACRTYR